MESEKSHITRSDTLEKKNEEDDLAHNNNKGEEVRSQEARLQEQSGSSVTKIKTASKNKAFTKLKFGGSYLKNEYYYNIKTETHCKLFPSTITKDMALHQYNMCYMVYITIH